MVQPIKRPTQEVHLARVLFRAIQAAYSRLGWTIILSQRTPANQHGKLLGHCYPDDGKIVLFVLTHDANDPLPQSLLHEQLHAIFRFGDDGSGSNQAEEAHVLALERLLWPRLTDRQVGSLKQLLRTAKQEEPNS